MYVKPWPYPKGTLCRLEANFSPISGVLVKTTSLAHLAHHGENVVEVKLVERPLNFGSPMKGYYKGKDLGLWAVHYLRKQRKLKGEKR